MASRKSKASAQERNALRQIQQGQQQRLQQQQQVQATGSISPSQSQGGAGGGMQHTRYPTGPVPPVRNGPDMTERRVKNVRFLSYQFLPL